MTKTNQPGERLPLLLAELLDGQMSEPQLTELQELLRDDPAARQIYARHMVTHALLTWEHGQVAAASSPSPLMGEAAAHSPSPLMGEGRGEGLSPITSQLTPVPTKSPVLGFLGGVIDYVSQSRTLMFWLIGGMLGLYFAVQLGSLLMSRFWAQNAAQVADDRGAGIEDRGQFAGQAGAGVGTGKIVARLTNAVDCQWALEAQPPSPQPSPIRGEGVVELAIGTQLYAGQRLHLTAGLAELTFSSGARVILTAPTQFDLTDALGGDLQLGKLAARVPHDSTGRGAIGFAVGTPSGKVVDLGTEFGVKVLADRTTNVVVYVGEVEVNAPGGASASGDSEPHTIVHVKAGQAVTVGPDKTVKPISADNERFVRDLAPLGSKQESQAAYADFVKRLKPVVWLRMEGNDDDRLLHDDAGAKDAKLFWDGPGNPFVKGRIGKGLWLRGDKLKDCAILADYPKAEHGKLTVAAWAYAESRSNFATIAKNWHHGEGLGQFHFGLISKFNWNDASYHPDGEDLGVEVAQADGTTAAVREGAEHAFPLGQWQHVAFVADGENVHLYRQGREVAVAKCIGVKFPVGLKALGIGAKPDEEGAAADIAYPGFWTGKLDEITIFNAALTADEIQKLAAAAPR